MLIQCDASQLEWRTALELSQDQVGIQEIIDGGDFHAKNQEEFRLPSRLIAKIFLFRTIFRGSGWSFANDPDFMHVSTSSEFWDGMNESFYKKYHGLDKQHHIWKDTVMAGRPIEGPLGRSWTIPIRDSRGELKIPWTLLSNYPVQGTGADVMMIARIMAKARIKKAGIPCDWISTVHDSIVLDCRSEYLVPIKDIFESVFKDLPLQIKRVYKYEWITPMACEVKAGKNLKEMLKV